MTNDVTALLEKLEGGDPQAAEALLPLVYTELRRLASARMTGERPGATLQPTALVHEAWLRVAGEGDGGRFATRAHFFAAAAEAMRRILIERARSRLRIKRGGGHEHVPMDGIDIAAPAEPDDYLVKVHDALAALEKLDERKATLVKLRYFVGLPFDEISGILNISVPTLKRDWAFSRAWLQAWIQDTDG
jgi:RNA polymerase sigma factor (TIGR02999 family)